MQDINNIISEQNNIIIFTLIILQITFLLFLIFFSFKLYNIQKRYKKFMLSNNLDMEQLLIEYANKTEEVKKENLLIKEVIQELKDKFQTTCRKISITRYKAIADVGGDLSFVVALLDEKNDGVLLNGIYSREGSYTYAKPIINGKCKYRLSEEEIETLKDAVMKN